MAKWWQQEAAEVAGWFRLDQERGLAPAEAEKRLREHGPNRLTTAGGISGLSAFCAQFRDFMVLVLIGAAGVSWVLGERADAAAILAIVILNAVLGFVQEYRAEKSLRALRALAAPQARVRRDGRLAVIPADQVVPGDLLLLEAGDRVAADCRLLRAADLLTNEAALTGESMPVAKTDDPIGHPRPALGDRRNMVFAGTTVAAGRGEGVVVATGMATEIGQIAGLIKEAAPGATPLQQRLEQVGRWLVFACLFVCGAVGAAGVARGESFRVMFMAAVSLGVAAIPEGLPAIVTISLALGVQRMVKRSAVVRRLAAVETLGCATVICSDKTGTITRNEMTVTTVIAGGDRYVATGAGYTIGGEMSVAGGGPVQTAKPPASPEESPLTAVLSACVLCNNAEINVDSGGREWRVEGDPTEAALLIMAAKAGLTPAGMRRLWPRRLELPFSSERKRMSVICQGPTGRTYLFTKGAADTVLALCKRRMNAFGTEILTAGDRRDIERRVDELAADALRVLALAYRPCFSASGIDLDQEQEKDLVFLGLVGMMDPPRAESTAAVRACRGAGIKTVMITGDHPLTARAVGREIGLLERGGRLLTGEELDAMDDAALAARIDQVGIYARVSPRHKLRIVKALKARGHVVAMTGDGVNDAPAVKEADIGVAMGRTGTEVTKEAASLILLDDNFATVVAAVEEGRAIYDNIRKFIRYLLGCNTGEILTMFLAMLLGLPLPLLPLQILWTNLVTDGLPALALGLEEPESDVMARPPRPPREGLFARGMWARIFWQGAAVGLCTMVGFALTSAVFPGQLGRARTVAFTILVLSQLFYALVCRSEHASLRRLNWFGNPYLVWTVVFSFLLQVSVVYLPFFSRLFGTTALGVFDWVCIAVLTLWSGVLGEGYRVARRFVGRAVLRPRTGRSGYPADYA